MKLSEEVEIKNKLQTLIDLTSNTTSDVVYVLLISN